MNELSAPIETGMDKVKKISKEVVIKTLDSMHPFLGTTLSPFIGIFLHSNYPKNLQQFYSEVADRLNVLTDFQENFPYILFNAIQTAFRQANKEKLDALKNAIFNSADGIKIETDLQLRFLHLVDVITPLGIKILKFLLDHEATLPKEIWSCEDINSTFSNEAKIPLTLDEFRFHLLILKNNDLLALNQGMNMGYKVYEGIIPPDYYQTEADKHKGHEEPYYEITKLGRDFIKFISAAAQA